MKPLVLASASPRRKELLEAIGLDFVTDAAEAAEEAGRKLEPSRLVKAISLKKARSAASRHPDSIIIAADTLGVLDDRLLTKPGGARQAAAMLRSMSGRWHAVLTGFTVLDSGTGKYVSNVVKSEVHFRNLGEEEIADYVRSGEPLDKAGSYGIQGLGSSLVDEVRGDYYNVIGLPLAELAKQLKKFGVVTAVPPTPPPAIQSKTRPEG